MSNNLNINQQQQTPVEGDLDLQIQRSQTITGVLSANQVTALVAGSSVKFDSAITVGGIPQFVAAAVGDVAVGYIKRTVQAASFNTGDKVEVVGNFGPVMWLTAHGTILPGATVEDYSTAGQVQTKSAQKARGLALDYATDGQLIRIMIIDPVELAA
jgi:hypothetical protein